MKIDEDLEAVISCTADRGVEIRRLTLDVRFTTGYVVRPEPDGDADMIKTGS